MITAGLIFCLLYSIDILILKKGGKPSLSDCKKGKGHAMQCMMNAHHMMDAHH